MFGISSKVTLKMRSLTSQITEISSKKHLFMTWEQVISRPYLVVESNNLTRGNLNKHLNRVPYCRNDPINLVDGVHKLLDNSGSD